jgi:catechol 2,3-dioxygenase-like lactoylglutathione lyase family enzyme
LAPWQAARRTKDSRTKNMRTRDETMLKTEGVLHFTIPVKNLDRSEKFYTELLGFEKVGRTERIVFLRAGDDFFNLTYSANPITLNPEGEHQIHSAFRVSSQTYDATVKALPAKGVDVFKQEDRQSGVFVGRSAYIRDPDGNVIEFIDLKRAPGRM